MPFTQLMAPFFCNWISLPSKAHGIFTLLWSKWGFLALVQLGYKWYCLFQKFCYICGDLQSTWDHAPSDRFYVALASTSTLLDPVTEPNWFKRCAECCLYHWLWQLAFSSCNFKCVRRCFSSVLWWTMTACHYFSRGLFSCFTLSDSKS